MITNRISRLAAALIAAALAAILVSGAAVAATDPVRAALPDTAVDVVTGDAVLGGVILLLVAVVALGDRFAVDRR